MFGENHEEKKECNCGKMDMMAHMMKMPKEMKIAMIEKKQKMMEAKIEFLGKMKEMVKNMPDKQ